MNTRLLNLWTKVRSSFWFIPSLMTVSAILLAFLTILLDRFFDVISPIEGGFFYTLGPSGARTLLATVAGSVITIAGVAFSITIVALTLASSQFGPRLLKNFMKDMGNQVVLGTLIATFLYCLLVLGAIRENGDMIFVPHISVVVGLLLTLTSMGVFIFFIHHISVSIHADTVVAGVSKELKASINHLFPEKMGKSPPPMTLRLKRCCRQGSSATVLALSAGVVDISRPLIVPGLWLWRTNRMCLFNCCTGQGSLSWKGKSLEKSGLRSGLPRR